MNSNNYLIEIFRNNKWNGGSIQEQEHSLIKSNFGSQAFLKQIGSSFLCFKSSMREFFWRVLEIHVDKVVAFAILLISLHEVFHQISKLILILKCWFVVAEWNLCHHKWFRKFQGLCSSYPLYYLYCLDTAKKTPQ